MQRLGVEKAGTKQAAGRVVEKLGRLRMHEKVTGDPGLSRLLELESLIVGVNGKLARWRALRPISAADDRLAGVDLDDLIGRAQGQLATLEEHHRAARRPTPFEAAPERAAYFALRTFFAVLIVRPVASRV